MILVTTSKPVPANLKENMGTYSLPRSLQSQSIFIFTVWHKIGVKCACLWSITNNQIKLYSYLLNARILRKAVLFSLKFTFTKHTIPLKMYNILSIYLKSLTTPVCVFQNAESQREEIQRDLLYQLCMQLLCVIFDKNNKTVCFNIKLNESDFQYSSHFLVI